MNKLEDIHLKPTSNRRYPGMRVLLLTLGMLITGWILLKPLMTTRAAAILGIEPTTWNVVGLNSIDVNAGPNTSPVAARVCNTGDTAATNVDANFVWVTNNSNINLSGPNTLNLPSLGAGSCYEFTFTIVVSRQPSAYNTSRGYLISVTADGLSSISTPLNREIYVQPLDASPNLMVVSITGPSNVNVGSTYQYVVQASTATDNYEQLEHILNFPTTLFRPVTVQAVYSSPPGAVNDQIYADACGWQNDPTLPAYLTCVGPVNYPGGTISGTLVTTYTVEVISSGAGTLTSTVYGFSSGSYRYNSDFAVDSLTVVASPAVPTDTATASATTTASATATITGTATATATVTGTPHTPTATATATATGTQATPTQTGTITPNPGATKVVTPAQAGIGQLFTFTLRITNNGSAPATNTRLEDSLDAYTYMDIYDLRTTKGTMNITGRKATVNIGTLNPGEVVVVTIVIRVNSTAVGTLTPCNVAIVRYDTSHSKNSNQQCFRVLGGPALPPTGELPLSPEKTGPPWDQVLLAILAALIGGLLLIIGVISRSNRRLVNVIVIVTGVFLLGVSIIAGISSLNPANWQPDASQVSIAIVTETAPDSALQSSASPTTNPMEILPAYLLATPRAFPTVIATLPSYPIPSPTMVATPIPGQDGPDTSPVIRIVIPALGVDTEVAYVPFDGHSWWIQGLREEVAWLGDTSWPGLGGNTALAGHVTVAGLGDGPFRYLSELAQNDEIRLYTERNIYTYRVRERLVVEETDLWVTDPTQNSQITLITCVEWSEKLQFYLKRLVVIADRVEVQPHAY